MSVPCFLGGTLLGNGAWAGFSILNESSRAEVEYPSFTDETASTMDREEVCHHLNLYFTKINMLSVRCSTLLMDNSALNIRSIVYQDDKEQNSGETMATPISYIDSEKMRSSLTNLREMMEALFLSYRPVFIRANHLLHAQEMNNLHLHLILPADQLLSFEDEIGDDDFASLSARMCDFVAQTTATCEQLMARLQA